MKHVEIDHPSFFKPLLKQLVYNLPKSVKVGLVFVPQEGKNNAGNPRCFILNEDDSDSIRNVTDFCQKYKRYLENKSVNSKPVDDTIKYFEISRGFNESIGVIAINSIANLDHNYIIYLTNHIADAIAKSKKSRLHEVLLNKFRNYQDQRAIFHILADTIKEGLYCTDAVVWEKQDSRFISHGSKKWDVVKGSNLVSKIYEDRTAKVTIDDIDLHKREILLYNELKEAGVGSFLLTPIKNQFGVIICVLGAFFQRKFGITNIDSDLIDYVTKYFEKIWSLHQENKFLKTKYRDIDKSLILFDKLMDFTVDAHSFNSIFDIIDNESNNIKIKNPNNRDIQDHIKEISSQKSLGVNILNRHSEVLIESGVLDDSVYVPTGERVTKVSPEDYLRGKITPFMSLAKRNDAELIFKPSANLPDTIRVDLDHVDLLLENYIKNAIYAVQQRSFGGGMVTVKAAVEQGMLILSVNDNGTGVPPEFEKLVFVKGVSTRLKTGGRGVGLAVAWKIGRIYKSEPILQTKWGFFTTLTSKIDVQ